MSPIQTSVPYQPADGVAVDLGEVQVRDLVVIAGAKGEVGTLSGMVLNNGTEPVTVTFATGTTSTTSTTGTGTTGTNTTGTSTTGTGTGDSSAQADVPAGTSIRLSGVEGATPVTLPDIATAPGGIMRITVSTPTAGAPEVSVPVLLPTGYYSAITPAPAQTSTP
jgi:hypothetical protein